MAVLVLLVAETGDVGDGAHGVYCGERARVREISEDVAGGEAARLN